MFYWLLFGCIIPVLHILHLLQSIFCFMNFIEIRLERQKSKAVMDMVKNGCLAVENI